MKDKILAVRISSKQQLIVNNIRRKTRMKESDAIRFAIRFTDTMLDVVNQVPGLSRLEWDELLDKLQRLNPSQLQILQELMEKRFGVDQMERLRALST